MARRRNDPSEASGEMARGLARRSTPKSKRGKKLTGVDAVVADPKRLAAWLKQPGLRAKLPDKYLSKEQQAQRKIARDPYHKQIEALVREQFGPAEMELGQAIQGSDRRQQRIGDYFGQYQQELARAQARQQAVQQQAVQGQQMQAQAFTNLAGQVSDHQQRAMAADAATRRTTVDPSVQKTAEDASLVRRNLSDLAATVMQGQGVNNNVMQEAAIAAATGMQARAREDETVRKGGLEAQLRELTGQKGAFRVKARGQLQDAERRAVLEDKAFGLDAATKINPETGRPYTVETATANREASSKNQAATRKSADRRWAATVNKYGVTNAAWRDWGKSPRGKAKRDAAIKRFEKKGGSSGGKLKTGLGSRTKADVQSFVKDINAAAKAIQGGTARSKILNAPGGRTPEERRAIANAANDMAKLGYLSPANVRALQRIGVNAGGFPRSREAARKAGTLPEQQVGDVLEDIGGAVGGAVGGIFQQKDKR